MSILENARQFFFKDARLLERHLFHYLFEGGPREAVLRALLAYGAEDGGFAYGLEPDKRSAHPQPIDQEQALQVLADIGPDDAVLARVLDFLPTITTLEGGVPLVLETVADAPRAPWWNTDPDPPAALNPTASIVGLLAKLGVTHPWLDRATAFVWEKLEVLTKKQQVDGGWPISWPAVSPGSELEYRSIVTLNALKTLRAYGTL